MIGERAINGKVTKGRMQCRMGKTRDESAVNRAAVRRDERNDRNERNERDERGDGDGRGGRGRRTAPPRARRRTGLSGGPAAGPR